jgi:uncharacterized membrane protein
MSTTNGNKELTHWVHRLLLAGVILTGMLLVAGLWQDPSGGTRPTAGQVISLRDLMRGSAHWEGLSLINLGLLMLMATPVLRIALLGVGWLIRGEPRFFSVAVVVFLLISLSMALGIG